MKNNLLRSNLIELEVPEKFNWNNLYSLLVSKIDFDPETIIKLNLVRTSKNRLYFYILGIDGLNAKVLNPFSPKEYSNTKINNENINVLIIPTGVGASIGGYAGDANPLAKLFSYDSEFLLTHPNILNAAVLTDIPPNALYLEGYLLDHFLLGHINLMPSKKNKIGVVFDSAIEPKRIDYEINTLNAAISVYGANIPFYTITDKPLNIKPFINNLGFSSGEIENIDSLFNKAIELKELGVDAIAVCCAIPDSDLNSGYIKGFGIDPVAGIEAIISHSISALTGLPSAHAPVLTNITEDLNYKNIAPVSSSEYIAQTFLPSVIRGLMQSPKIGFDLTNDNFLNKGNIKKIVVPHNAFGSSGVLNIAEEKEKVILVNENKTFLDVNFKDIKLNFNFTEKYLDLLNKNVISDSGINLKSLERPLTTVEKLNLSKSL